MGLKLRLMLTASLDRLTLATEWIGWSARWCATPLTSSLPAAAAVTQNTYAAAVTQNIYAGGGTQMRYVAAVTDTNDMGPASEVMGLDLVSVCQSTALPSGLDFVRYAIAALEIRGLSVGEKRLVRIANASDKCCADAVAHNTCRLLRRAVFWWLAARFVDIRQL
jgi:hypothetical protein